MALLPKDADILPPSDDHIFKTLLTHPDAKSVLIAVVSATTGHTIANAQVLNNELQVSDTEEKNERLDVNCTAVDSDGRTRQVDVEMHSSRIEENMGNHQNFIHKYIYYLTDLYSSQASSGVRYAELMPTYQITFCNYTIFPERPDFVHRIALRFPNGEPLSDHINMIIIEMSKIDYALKKKVGELTPLEIWALFFRYAPDPKYREIINQIINLKEEVAMASQLLQNISQSAEERARFRSRRMFETDLTSNILTAEERGEIRGKMAERLTMAAKMKAKDIDISTIIEVTELSVDDILKA